MSEQYSASPSDITNGAREVAGLSRTFNVITDGGAVPYENTSSAKAANDAAFTSAIQFGGHIIVPTGDYYTGKAIEIDNLVWLEGDNSSPLGQKYKARTQILPPLGACGIIVHSFDTSTSGGRGDGSVIDGIGVSAISTTPVWTTGTKTLGTVVCSTASSLDKRGVVFVCTTAGSSGVSEPTWSITPGTTTTDGGVVWTARRASGFVLFRRATLNACSARFMGGHGAEIFGYVSGISGTPGNTNSNGWQINGLVTMQNRADGLYVDGTDANAGCAIGVDSSLNERYGAYDSSFLGNAYIALQTATNGDAWFKADDLNARITLINAYSESDQVAGSVPNNKRVVQIGGLNAAGWDSGGTPLGLIDSQIYPFTVPSHNLSTQIGDSANPLILIATPASGASLLQWRYNVGWWDWAEAGLDSRAPIKIAGDQALTSVDPGTPWINRPLLLGLGDSYGQSAHFFASALIPSDSSVPAKIYKTGSIALNIGTDKTIIGWRCSSGGTPGTWEVISASAQLAANLTLAVSNSGTDIDSTRASLQLGGDLSAKPFRTVAGAITAVRAAVGTDLNSKTIAVSSTSTTVETITTGGFKNGTLTISGARLGASTFSDCDALTLSSAVITGAVNLDRCNSTIAGTVSGSGRVLVHGGQANVQITASGCSGSALRAEHVSYLGYAVAATTCTATPVELFNVAYSELVGSGLSGSNASAPFGVSLSGGGKHVLTGAAITGVAHLDLDGTTISWTDLSTKNRMSQGTFAYWGDAKWVYYGQFQIVNNSTSDFDDMQVRDLQFGRFFKQYGLNRPLDPAYTEITAHAGGGQGSATLIALQVTLVTSAASDNDSIRFFDETDYPGAGGGARGEVINGTTKTLKVWPKSGKKIYLAGVDQGTNTAIDFAAGARIIWTMDNSENMRVNVVT